MANVPTFNASTVNITSVKVAPELLLGALLGFEWKEVAFPATDFRVQLRQDLAQHKFADLDSADVEPTGRAPLEFTARIPFLNNIASAPSENWPSGDMYPTQFRQFFAACVDRSPGILIHPEFGPIRCVVERCSVDWKSQTRDGVYVDVAWIETFDEDGQVNANINDAGAVMSLAAQAGVDLDTLLPSLPPDAFPQLPKNEPSFADFARGLQSVSDQISLLQYQTAGKVDAILMQTQAVVDSISQATNSPSAASTSVQAWPTRDAADRYMAALNDVRKNLLATGKDVLIFIPRNDTSLPMLAQSIPAPVGDLLNLNPALVAEFVVPALTRVRYYKAS